MAHPRLDLDQRCAVDGHRAEVVAQRMKRQRPQFGALDGGHVASAQRARVEVPAGRSGEHRVLIGGEVLALAESREGLGDSGIIGTVRILPLLGVTSSPKL